MSEEKKAWEKRKEQLFLDKKNGYDVVDEGTVVAAAEYGADERLAAQGAAVSTIACFFVIPILMLLL